MNKIKNLIENGYNLDGLNLYNDTFQTYKKLAIPAGFIMLLLLILFGSVYMISLLSYFGNIKAVTSFLENLDPLAFSPQQLAYYILGTAAFNAITSLFSAGFIKMSRNVFHGALPKIGTVFSFFIKLDGLKIFAFTFVLQILYSYVSLVFQSYDLGLAGIFIFMLMHLLTLLVVPLIIFDKLPIHKAIQASASLVNQKPFIILSYMFLMASLSFFGLFLFLIGIIFTLPLFFCFNYCVYHHIVEKN